MLRLNLKPYVLLPIVLEQDIAREELIRLLDSSPRYVIQEAGGFRALVQSHAFLPWQKPDLLRDVVDAHIEDVLSTSRTQQEAAERLGVNVTMIYRRRKRRQECEGSRS